MAARKRRKHSRRQSAEHGTSNGRYWLYGRHAVSAAVANPERRLVTVLTTASGGLEGADIVTAEALAAQLPKDAVHQGYAALVEPLPPAELAPVLGAEAPLVVLDRVSDPRNVGAVLRSAAAFGAAAVVVPRRHAPAESGAMAKAASGALERMQLVQVTNLARALGQIAEAGFWVLGLDGDAERTLAEAAPQKRSALVLGAEGAGLRRLTAEACDELARLPIGDAVESLNVSAAATAALYELVRLSP
jgi:23S rRNA (guanosine2251-2'-O)-methyltransferase